jgi:hypothetical protein
LQVEQGRYKIRKWRIKKPYRPTKAELQYFTAYRSYGFEELEAGSSSLPSLSINLPF